MGPTICPETSVADNRSTLRNIAEEQRSQVGIVKSEMRKENES